MGVNASSTSLCLGNEHCLQWSEKLMGNATETASLTLGIISVVVWVVAEIPQIITNFREKSTEGLSVTFLLTWIIGDLFNIFGCLLEPATLLTQLYVAVLYTLITLLLCSQSIYYGHIYPRLQYNRQLKVDVPTNAGQLKIRMEIPYDDADQYDFDKRIGLSSPINVPELSQKNSVGRQLYYQSARYLSKSHTTTTQSILTKSSASSCNISNPIEDPLLSPSVLTQSAPDLTIKTTRCLVSAITFLSAFNLLQSIDTRTHSTVSKPRREFVIHVGRKLFQQSQVSGHPLPELASVSSSIGTLLGWSMAFIYMGGRLPQIYLNIRRGNFEGVNPLMFLFALVGNSTYVASILVRSLDWSRVYPNLPWLVESGGCALLDSFILMQYIFYRYRTSKGLEVKYKHQSVA